MLSAPKQLRWLLALTCIAMIMPAYGYLDGNSGSIIVQALLGGLAGILAIAKLYWHKFKNLVLRLLGKAPPESPDDHPDSLLEEKHDKSPRSSSEHHDKH